MRLIDADALNERIKSKMFELQNAIDYRFRERGDVNGSDRLLLEKYGFASQLIGKQPTISQWIPVGERLPQPGELVMTSNKSDIIICYIVGSESWCIGLDNERITAWMPLPEPYKEDDE